MLCRLRIHLTSLNLFSSAAPLAGVPRLHGSPFVSFVTPVFLQARLWSLLSHLKTPPPLRGNLNSHLPCKMPAPFALFLLFSLNWRLDLPPFNANFLFFRVSLSFFRLTGPFSREFAQERDLRSLLPPSRVLALHLSAKFTSLPPPLYYSPPFLFEVLR